MRILKTVQTSPVTGQHPRRGAALMVAMLVLFALIMIVFQITMNAGTDRRIARNDRQLTKFDLAIESVLLKVFEDLAEDAAAGQGADMGDDPTGGFPPPGGPGGEEGGDEEADGPTDSRKDEWARPQRTEINGVSLRILIQDEDSKLNVLTMLTEDRDEAEKAFDRVVRVLDLCRENTTQDIDGGEARDMADSMRDFLQDRENAVLPIPSLLTDEDTENDFGMPLTLREFVVLDGFEVKHFRDYRDSEGAVVHSIGSFLTVSTSLSTYDEFREDIEEASQKTGAVVDAEDTGGIEDEGDTSTDQGSEDGIPGADGSINGDGTGAGGAAGVAVNVNTAPNAVLHAIMDRNEISWTFLDDLLAYRNEEEELDPSAEELDPVYDEYGQEVVERQIFDNLEELSEVYSWDNNEPALRDEFKAHLTVESHVFSIFVTARFSTSSEGDNGGDMSREDQERAEEQGTDLTRTVRCMVWRYQDGEEFVIVPLERWEVLDYRPYEVLDYPDEDR